MIAGPGIEGGTKSDALVYLPSIYPTTCEIAGLQVPETVDFPSIKGIIDGNEEKVHDAIFGCYRHFQRMVRTDKYKMILYPHVGEQQLFDIENDPEEMVNLIENDEYAAVKVEMFNLLLAQQKEVGDTLTITLQ